MLKLKSLGYCLFTLLFMLGVSSLAMAQRSGERDESEDFGPVMRAYLGYLANEQEVVDDRASRREISTAYYRRNSNRIRALRSTALRLVRRSGNDYVPELEAVTVDEFSTIFEKPPRPSTLHAEEIIANKFRFLNTVRSGELFYVFARLNPYEQADLMQRQNKTMATASGETNPGAKGQRVGQTAARPRRVTPEQN